MTPEPTPTHSVPRSSTSADRWVERALRLAVPALWISFALLLLVGVAGPSAAKPGLGPRGWAPGGLAWSPGPALVTGVLWAAYFLGALAVALHLARPSGRLTGWLLPAGLGLAALLTEPFGSADHTNYAAYGRIAALGGDPYLTPPSAWSATDPVTSSVEPPWTDTVSVYGPFATLLQSLASHVGGANLRQTVWAWQLLIVLAWLGVRWVLVRAGADRHRVDTLWTLNPIVFGIGVLGAHVDLMAAALAVTALVVATRNPLVAGLLVGLAVSTKVTYGVVGLAVLLGWWAHQRSRFRSRAWQFVAGALVAAAPLHLWAGPHVFDQLDRARRSISFATPWRLLYEALSGPLASGTARSVVSWLAVALALVLVVLLARLTRGLAHNSVTGAAARWALVLGAAYTLAAPYSLPWYDLLLWAVLPLLAASPLDMILLLRFTVVALAYVPGRVVGMTPTVERVTLGVRSDVVPYAVLVVWGWLTFAAARASRRPTEPRPPAP
jgi:hypothetical protein